ncbi:Glucokinase [Lentibacillus sp. JNUCC-1]|uniref:ROK family transcriptional regulator n=1 Tax=Lentibacillus sp. JNUCC-1 TaxID=2654513 RepID=UPI0012E915B1|nr:ROK family transcriptional regulator [Lentibacillus sp. JNUCC-1]MUV36882.1 Glucokinase [Lentibacillus sp. JNUCC-1]
MERGSFQLMKSVNKSLVLNKIRINQPISRAQIAKDTKLTPPTVSSIVRELIAEELVIESVLGESQGGRKPTMLLINDDAFYVIGVEAGPDKMSCTACNLAGKVIERTDATSIAAPISKEQFLSDMIGKIQSVLDALPEPDKVLGIGVAMHGVVDVDKGLSLVAPNLDLRDIPVADVLEERFNTIVKVENDVRAMALGESWFSAGQHKGSMLMVNMDSGVGAGLVIDGKLYHGAADLAGEVGHMTIDLNGEVCSCGNKGCFQTFASEQAVVERAKAEKRKQGPITEDQLTIYDIHKQAATGDEVFAQVLRETGHIIGVALTNLIHVINPDCIILGGSVSRTESIILPEITHTIEERGLTQEAKATKVTTASFGENATTMGAASLLLTELFEGQ